jgi:hypothetical protein
VLPWPSKDMPFRHDGFHQPVYIFRNPEGTLT